MNWVQAIAFVVMSIALVVATVSTQASHYVAATSVAIIAAGVTVWSEARK